MVLDDCLNPLTRMKSSSKKSSICVSNKGSLIAILISSESVVLFSTTNLKDLLNIKCSFVSMQFNMDDKLLCGIENEKSIRGVSVVTGESIFTINSDNIFYSIQLLDNWIIVGSDNGIFVYDSHNTKKPHQV